MSHTGLEIEICTEMTDDQGEIVKSVNLVSGNAKGFKLPKKGQKIAEAEQMLGHTGWIPVDTASREGCYDVLKFRFLPEEWIER